MRKIELDLLNAAPPSSSSAAPSPPLPLLAFELLRDLERDDADADDEVPSRPRVELVGSDDDDDDAPKVMARMTAAAMVLLLLSKGACAGIRSS